MISVLTENTLFTNARPGVSLIPNKYTLGVIENGNISIENNEGTYNYRGGNVILIVPNNVYKINSFTNDIKAYFILMDRDELNSKISFVFNRYEMLQVFRSSNYRIDKLSYETSAHILSLSNQLYYYNRSEKDIAFSHQIQLYLLTSIIYILTSDFLKEKQGKVNLFDNSRKEAITMEFMKLVSNNFYKEKELKFYADKLLVSPKYLSNTVKEITNQPPSKFITEATLNRAKIQLLSSAKSIKEIANELFFSDQYAFGKFFKKHTGLSPSNYKKINKLLDAI